MRAIALVALAALACDSPQVAQQIRECEPEIVERVVEVTVPAACDPELPPEPAVPDGFPAVDEFLDEPKRAGRVITARVVCTEVVSRINDMWACEDPREEQRRRSIYNHWKRRIKFASHGGKHRSRLNDGTAIHDRDRPAGYVFWHRAVGEGWLTPDTCAWHQIDPHVGHTATELRWAVKWPFTSSPLPRERLESWLRESHDYERFVARGPNDGSPAYMTHLFEDRCFDPAQFDRNDVSAYAHARKTMKLCAEAEADGVACSYAYLRCTWGLKGRRRCAERHAEPAQP